MSTHTDMRQVEFFAVKCSELEVFSEKKNSEKELGVLPSDDKRKQVLAD